MQFDGQGVTRGGPARRARGFGALPPARALGWLAGLCLVPAGCGTGAGAGVGATASGGATYVPGVTGGDFGAGSGGVSAGSGGAPPTSSGGDTAASGGGEPAGSGGSTSLPLPDAGGYDPSVQFEWPETPTPLGTCDPGTYVGTFTCSMEWLPGFKMDVTGPITFQLEPSANGEFLEIKNGRLDATANGTYPFGADLVGNLDCSQHAFAADAQNGTYGAGLFSGVFFGSMSGNLDPLTGTLSGQWALTPGTAAAPQGQPCIGPWSATKQP